VTLGDFLLGRKLAEIAEMEMQAVPAAPPDPAPRPGGGGWRVLQRLTPSGYSEDERSSGRGSSIGTFLQRTWGGGGGTGSDRSGSGSAGSTSGLLPPSPTENETPRAIALLTATRGEGRGSPESLGLFRALEERGVTAQSIMTRGRGLQLCRSHNGSLGCCCDRCAACQLKS
jgi:hypothetical protein